LTVAVVLVATLSATSAGAQDQNASSVVVTGEGVVRRLPDRAFVILTTEARSKSPRDAQRANAEAMESVQQRLRGSRLASDAIRTLGYDLQQEYDFVNNRRVARDYVARNTIEVRIDDIARVGELLDLGVGSGATQVSGVRFDLKSRDAAEREALRLAVERARAKAEAAASGAGRSLDRIVRVEEEGAIVQPLQPRMAMLARADAAPADTPIVAGDIEIRARVTLTATIK
jgi:uncharacterized protein YggE